MRYSWYLRSSVSAVIVTIPSIIVSSSSKTSSGVICGWSCAPRFFHLLANAYSPVKELIVVSWLRRSRRNRFSDIVSKFKSVGGDSGGVVPFGLDDEPAEFCGEVCDACASLAEGLEFSLGRPSLINGAELPQEGALEGRPISEGLMVGGIIGGGGRVLDGVDVWLGPGIGILDAEENETLRLVAYCESGGFGGRDDGCGITRIGFGMDLPLDEGVCIVPSYRELESVDKFACLISSFALELW